MRQTCLVFAVVTLGSVALAGVGRANTNPFFKTNTVAGELPARDRFTVAGASPADVSVAFEMLQPDGSANLFVKTGSGPITPVGGPDFHTLSSGAIAGITGGAVAGRFVDPGGPNTGVFLFPPNGGARQVLSDTRVDNPSFAPATSPGGDIVFQDLHPGTNSSDLIVRTSGGVRLTINGSGFARMGRPAITTAHDVAFVGSPAATSASEGSSPPNIYVGSAHGGPLTPILNDPNLVLASDNLTLEQTNNQTRVSFVAVDISRSQVGIYHSDQFTPQGLFSAPQLVIASSATASISEVFSTNSQGQFLSRKGYQYYMARSQMNAAGSAPEAADPVLLIGIGDSVGGSTVTDIFMSESSLLDSGEALLYLTLANGDRGFYFVTVPEPTMLGVLFAVPAIATRRRS